MLFLVLLQYQMWYCDYHYCTTSFNKTSAKLKLKLRFFVDSNLAQGVLLMRVFDDGLLWINAENPLVSMKTIHHHHWESEETSSFSFFSELQGMKKAIIHDQNILCDLRYIDTNTIFRKYISIYLESPRKWKNGSRSCIYKFNC